MSPERLNSLITSRLKYDETSKNAKEEKQFRRQFGIKK